MELVKGELQGVAIIKPKIMKDERGYFMESYKNTFFQKHFPKINFIQENESFSNYGVLRGLHYQKSPFEQTKLVRVIQGEILDIIVDIRNNSKTFGKCMTIKLSSENKHQLLVPKGFAHGFLVLSKSAIVQYKVDNPYSPEHESGISFDDPSLKLELPIAKHEIIISQKDKVYKKLNQIEV